VKKKHLLKLGVLWITVPHWGCLRKTPNENSNSHPSTRWGDIEDTDISSQEFTGIIDGVYHSNSAEFSLEIPTMWQVDVSGQLSGLQLRLENAVDDCAIEIWKYEGIQYRPVSREGCIWSFQDKGLYIDWGNSRAVNVATCHPVDSSSDMILVYLAHKDGNTWQLESYISRNNLVEGVHQAESVLQAISWSDDVTNQKEQQSSVKPNEN